MRAAVSLAVAHNQDIQVAVLNVERARQLQGITRSESLPGFEVNGSSGRSHRTPTSSSISVAMASYEIDLFGRVKNLKQRALHDYLRRDEIARGARITVESETVQAWLALAADMKRERGALMRLQLLTGLYERTLLRFRHGADGQAELARADTAVQAAKQDALARSIQVQKSQNALELTIGGGLSLPSLPEADTPLEDLFKSNARVPREVPSELLLLRPDVLTAEHALQAAYAGVGVARAERLPRLSITSSYSTALDGGHQSRSIWDAAANLAAPLIDHGAARMRAGVATMDQQIATAEYRRTVHAAIRETGDVLADADAADRAVCTAAAVVAAAQRQMTIERRRYEAGASALSDFLRAEQLLSMAEDQKIQASQSRVGGYVALYRVLGGTWAVHTQTVNDHSAITRGDGCED